MPLEDLLATIETLRGRIERHGSALQKSEAQTRYTLVDPLLRALGWDLSDPQQVLGEFQSDAGRADYALLGEASQPAVIVEAKRLGAPLTAAVSQVINYCIKDGFNYFAVTNGQRWELYETHRHGNLAEKLVTSFDVKGSASDACLKALALWRPSVEEERVGVGSEPVVTQPKNVPPMPPPPPPDEGAWVSLTQVPTNKGTPLPPELRLPDGTTKGISSWAAILVELTRWLIAKDAIKPATLPLKGSANNYILATSPVGPTGKAFKNAQQVGEIWLAPHGNIFGTLQKAQRIIEHAGRNPADFKVRLAD